MTERASGQNFYEPGSKKKVDRGAVGSSMMSGHSAAGNSNEARDNNDSPARPQANQSKNSNQGNAAGGNTLLSMDDPRETGFIKTPVKKPDHRKYDRERPKPYLDWNDFYE